MFMICLSKLSLFSTFCLFLWDKIILFCEFYPHYYILSFSWLTSVIFVVNFYLCINIIKSCIEVPAISVKKLRWKDMFWLLYRLAEPIDELQRSYEQFLRRMKKHNYKKVQVSFCKYALYFLSLVGKIQLAF